MPLPIRFRGIREAAIMLVAVDVAPKAIPCSRRTTMKEATSGQSLYSSISRKYADVPHKSSLRRPAKSIYLPAGRRISSEPTINIPDASPAVLIDTCHVLIA